MEEQKNHWGIIFVVTILVLIIAIQGFMLHGLRQRVDKIEGKSGANPVASQTEPRSSEEAVSEAAQPSSENQSNTSGEAAPQPATENQTTTSETTQQADQSAQNVKPTFPVEVTQTQTLASTDQPTSTTPLTTQKDTARLAVPPMAPTVSPATPTPAPEPKAQKVVTIPTVPAPELVEEWTSEFPDENNDYWNSWEEIRNFETSMRKMFWDEGYPRVMNFDPTATPMEVNVVDKGDVYEVALNTPDVDLSSMTVRVENRRFLKVSGMKKRFSEGQNPCTGMATRSEEIRHFVQGVFLPEPVNGKKIKVCLDQGWFKIIVPKIKK